jgi:hypothetical protein
MPARLARRLHDVIVRRGIAALLALAACQPLPQPFHHDESEANPLITLRDGPGVALRPIDGLDLVLSDEITSEVVRAFAAQDVPASAVAENRASFHLLGKGSVRDVPGGKHALEIEWQLADAAGTVLEQHKQQVAFIPGVERQEGFVQLAQSLVARIMPKIAEPIPRSALPEAVLVFGIAGAPGDGGNSLKRAIEYVLTKNGVPLAQASEDNILVVAGAIEMGKPQAGTQTITIRWTLHGPDGTEIGAVTQSNKVPAGSLDHAWGETAFLVAEAAYDGIGALLQRVWSPPVKPPAS